VRQAPSGGAAIKLFQCTQCSPELRAWWVCTPWRAFGASREFSSRGCTTLHPGGGRVAQGGTGDAVPGQSPRYGGGHSGIGLRYTQALLSRQGVLPLSGVLDGAGTLPARQLLAEPCAGRNAQVSEDTRDAGPKLSPTTPQARRDFMNGTLQVLLPQRSEPPIHAQVVVDFHVGTQSSDSLRTDLHGGAAKVSPLFINLVCGRGETCAVAARRTTNTRVGTRAAKAWAGSNANRFVLRAADEHCYAMRHEAFSRAHPAYGPRVAWAHRHSGTAALHGGDARFTRCRDRKPPRGSVRGPHTCLVHLV
jgi:hypothetical protein